ncbi:MAG TPA: hypothetical protein VIW03_10590 [Anaeromyxobacter sp.]
MRDDREHLVARPDRALRLQVETQRERIESIVEEATAEEPLPPRHRPGPRHRARDRRGATAVRASAQP